MNAYLETAISLVLIFALFSIIVYVVQEIIAINLKYRGKMLWKSLAQLLDGYTLPGRAALNKPLPAATGRTPITDALYQHPQIQSLRKNLKSLPSYIPAANFALAVLDLVAKAAPVAGTDFYQNVRAGLTTFVAANGDAYGVLKNLADTSADIKELQAKIEAWYNSYMDRVTGWYQSHTLLSIRLIAVGVALFFNINVINLTRVIYTNTQVRAGLVAIAERVTDHPETVSEFYTRNFEAETHQLDEEYQQALHDTTKTPAQKQTAQQLWQREKAARADTFTKKRIAAMDSLTKQLSDTGLPLGWAFPLQKNFKGVDKSHTAGNVALALLGWAIAAGCLSMGAPFWFDLLLKLVNVRRAGIKPTADNEKRQ